MNLCLAVILSAFLSTSYAQTQADLQTTTTTTETKTTTKPAVMMVKKKKLTKLVKTNGVISTSGCETASGKKLSENDFGYEDCVKQIGTKK